MARRILTSNVCNYDQSNYSHNDHHLQGTCSELKIEQEPSSRDTLPSSFVTRTFFWACPLAVRTAKRPAAARQLCRPTPKAFDLALALSRHLFSLYRRPEWRRKRSIRGAWITNSLPSSPRRPVLASVGVVSVQQFAGVFCGRHRIARIENDLFLNVISAIHHHKVISYRGPPMISPSSPTAGAAGARAFGSVPGAALKESRKVDRVRPKRECGGEANHS